MNAVCVWHDDYAVTPQLSGGRHTTVPPALFSIFIYTPKYEAYNNDITFNPTIKIGDINSVAKLYT